MTLLNSLLLYCFKPGSGASGGHGASEAHETLSTDMSRLLDGPAPDNDEVSDVHLCMTINCMIIYMYVHVHVYMYVYVLQW